MVSRTGTCSGIATNSLIPDSKASVAACRKNFAGTKIIEICVLVAATASLTFSKIGILSSNF